MKTITDKLAELLESSIVLIKSFPEKENIDWKPFIKLSQEALEDYKNLQSQE